MYSAPVSRQIKKCRSDRDRDLLAPKYAILPYGGTMARADYAMRKRESMTRIGSLVDVE